MTKYTSYLNHVKQHSAMVRLQMMFKIKLDILFK